MGHTSPNCRLSALIGLVFWTAVSSTCDAESILYSQDFDNLNGGSRYVDAEDVLGSEWTFEAQSHVGNQAGGSTPSPGTSRSDQGRARIYSWGGSRGGVLVLDDTTGDNIYSLNEAILELDLLNQSDVMLTFDHYDSDDENHLMGTDSFEGHLFADGVAVSSDAGDNWVPLVEFSQGNNTWREYTASISDLVESSSLLQLTSSFLIKFQQYDNYYHGKDGRKFDDILVTSSGTTPGTPTNSPVPEPATATLFGIGLMGMACVRRRRRRQAEKESLEV